MFFRDSVITTVDPQTGAHTQTIESTW